MSEDKVYKDGDIVWVKLGNNWWPGEVTGPNRHPEGLIKHLKRVPYCVVKFFNENTYEYVRSSKQIFPFQCAKQEEFVRKGYSLYNSGNSFMEKFPNDVEVAKQLTRRKETSLILNDRPDSIVKAILGQPLIRICEDYYDGSEYREKRRSGDSVTKILNITKNSNDDSLNNEKNEKQTSTFTTSNLLYNKTKNVAKTATNNNNNSGNYQCNFCDFSSVRQNVMILHRKMHSNRNSVGSSNTKSAATNANSVTSLEETATTTNVKNSRNQTQHNQIAHKDKTNNATKVSAIATATTRSTRTPTLSKEISAAATPTFVTGNSNEATEPATPKEKTNRYTRAQTLTRNEEKSNRSKITKKLSVKEKKEESAYATILSDFCPSESETSPSTEEKQSRRSLRNCKNLNESTREKTPTVCIDLSETKTIQKIPKKREYKTVQVEKKNTPEVAPIEPDVVCLSDREKDITTATASLTINAGKPQKNAEDIRRMLLADWSDDDETPNDAIVVEEITVGDNMESTVCTTEVVDQQNNCVALTLTSTPNVKPAGSSIGRIRNIPKKDRRDVVLQDFNSDLSHIQNEKLSVSTTKTMAMDLDSSNSSVVEIIEDEQAAAIITINDEEDQEISKTQQNQNDSVAINSKENDLIMECGIHDKSGSAATSNTSLSCFDFQEEEDEQETTTTTISHFKKKYLSAEKLHNFTSSTDEAKDDFATKNRAELAEKDQRLADEIETLLEQTQPPVADLLKSNSFEESMSVKDLPIKERGKRIFKSRNKTRQEEKNNTLTGAEADTASGEQHISTENHSVIEENINNENEDNNEQDYLQASIEISTDHKIITSADEDAKRKQNLNENSSHEILYNQPSEVTKLFDDKQLTPNENKENEDLALEVSNGDHTTSTEILKEIIEKEIVTVVDDAEENKKEKRKTIEQPSNEINYNENGRNNISAVQELNEQIPITEQQEADEIATVLQTEQESLAESHGICKDVETINKSEKSNKIVTENIGIASENENSEEIKINLDKSLAKEIITPQANVIKIAKDIELQTLGNVYKIRVKSPDQLFDQAFVMTPPQPEQELQMGLDSNVDTRVMTITPTDENSSMGASDTGAEFGSPTSMLSEERLPTFRFQSNQTPQQELEVAEAAVLQEVNAEETEHRKTSKSVAQNDHVKAINDQFCNQKSLWQRRFSLDINIDTKPHKRQRLSEDNITTTHPQNNFEKPKESLTILPSSTKKVECKIWSKNRHVKITPRRNVSELFDTSLTKNHSISKGIEKVRSLDTVIETEIVQELMGPEKTSVENYNKDENDSQNKNSNGITMNKNELNIEHQPIKDNHIPSVENTELSADNESNITTNKHQMGESFNNKQKKEEINKEKLKTTTEKDLIVKEKEKIDEPNTNEYNLEEMDVTSETKSISPTNEATIAATLTNNKGNEIISPRFNTKDYETIQNNTSSISGESEIVGVKNNNCSTEALATGPTEPLRITVETLENVDNSTTAALLLDKTKSQNDNGLEIPYSPGVPPPTPQEREVVIETENLNHNLCDQTKTDNEIQSEITVSLETQNENSDDLEGQRSKTQVKEVPLIEQIDHTKQILLTQAEDNTSLREDIVKSDTVKETETSSDKEIVPPLTPTENELFEGNITPNEKNINKANVEPANLKETQPISEPEIVAQTLISQPVQNMTLASDNVERSCTFEENYAEGRTENLIQTPLTPQAKDLIIECEPSTPQGIIECDHNLPAQITPEKEVIIESDIVLANPTSVVPDKDIIIEESLQLEEKEILLEREFKVLQAKDITVTTDAGQETETNILQTDADKAAEEFLIEFDSIVNHSHSVEDDVPNSAAEDVINAEDLINNIIEEVHEDHQLKEDPPAKTESTLQYEPVTTYTLVAPKNSWNQIFKDSFNKQLPLAKRRQTICFEFSHSKEGVACKKQALDFESILPVSKTIKRTAERKLTLPAIETKLSNSHQQQQNIFALNHNQLTLNKKLLTTAKRKLSIEDNITSFIIERPKQPQQPSNAAASGPPPLQRIRSLTTQGHFSSKPGLDNLPEPPPLQSNDSLYQELFQPDSSSTSGMETPEKNEGARTLQKQFLTTPCIASITQNRMPSDTKISKNKQIGIDSRGNKYVIIKTPPTDIVVQPTITPSTAAAVTAANNFGTTITIQPLARSSSDSSVTKAATKNSTVAASTITPTRKQPNLQQLQPTRHQQMKQIAISVPAKSPIEISKSHEVTGKTQPRHRRRSAHAKAMSTTPPANSISSAKHRQAIEALSRRLSIAAEAPPLAKISRTSTHVQTQISNTSNLTTFFADTQISNIAQQQLMQLQQQQHQLQQQQQTQTASTSSLPPPIILNKNAHQHSVIQRKARKITQQIQQQQQQYNLHQQQQAANSAKASQIIQQLQQQQQIQLHQHQEIQHQHFIAQLTTQQPQQQHTALQPPPLQQIQTQTVPVVQQQIVQPGDGIIITTASTEDDNVIDSNTQLIALPTQPYPGYSETFLLCKVKGNTCKPVDNVPLYLNQQLNELVPVPLEALEGGHKPQEHQSEMKVNNAPQQLLAVQNNTTQNNDATLQMTNLNCNLVEGGMSSGIEADQHHQNQQQQQIMEECVVDENAANANNNQIGDFSGNQDVNPELVSNNGILLNIEGQQVLLDAATFAHLLANPDANTQLISDDGTEYVLTHEVLAALQMQQEQQQAIELANAAAAEQQQQQLQHQMETPGGSDIIAVALAGSELYDNDVLTIDTSQGMQLLDGDGSIVFPAQTGAITQQHLTPPAVVTNAVLDQSPIMSTLEVPSSIATAHKLQGSQLVTVPSHHLTTSANAALGVGGRSNLEDSLAAIGVTTQSSSIPSSLGLPITVTNPNIASKVTSAGPLNEMLQFVSHRPATAAATAAAVAAAALAGESRIFTD